MPMFSKGIILVQHKEPAFSRPLLRFVNTRSQSLRQELRRLSVQTKEEAIIEIARLANIVDERDGKLLYRKLIKCRGKVKIVIADAVDDEPYVSSKIVPLLQMRDEVSDGLELCCDVAGCDNKLVIAYKMISDLHTHVPRSINKIRVVKLRGGYPADKKRRLARFGPPSERLIVGVGALIHLSRAIYQQIKQDTVFVTVAGNCVTTQMNLEVSIGMTVMQVLERCGLSQEPTRVVCGGSMTGVSIIDPDNTLVTYTTRAILAFRENHRDAHYTCIGCGRCEQVCPAGLNPMYIRKFVQNSYYANLAPFDTHLCTGCGTCSYVCPSKLEVAPAVRAAMEYARRNFKNAAEDQEEEDPPTQEAVSESPPEVRQEDSPSENRQEDNPPQEDHPVKKKRRRKAVAEQPPEQTEGPVSGQMPELQREHGDMRENAQPEENGPETTG